MSAFLTGEYRNFFAEIGKSEEEIIVGCSAKAIHEIRVMFLTVVNTSIAIILFDF